MWPSVCHTDGQNSLAFNCLGLRAAGVRSMADTHWTLDDIPWDRFEADKVDPDQEKIIRSEA